MIGRVWQSKAAHLLEAERRKGLGTRYTVPGHAPRDLLPPTRPHILWFPLPPNNVFKLVIHPWTNQLMWSEPHDPISSQAPCF